MQQCSPNTNIQETSELTFMRSKYPSLKQKIQQPFPYFYQAPVLDEQIYTKQLKQLKQKLKQKDQNTQPCNELTGLQSIAIGKIEGMPGIMTPWVQLSQLFEYDKKDFWTQILKQKLTLKSYGQLKQKQYTMWQVKNIDTLKQMYNIQEIKKQRKIVKQFSAFYKAACKFVQKYEKLSKQEQVEQLYTQYKKVETQQTKMNKIILSQKNKVVSISMPDKIAYPAMESKKPQVQAAQNTNQDIPNFIKQNQMQKQAQISSKNNQQSKQKGQNKTKNKQKNENKKKVDPKQPSSNKKQTKSSQKPITGKYMSLDLFFKKKQVQNKPVQQHANQPKPNKMDAFISALSFNKSQTTQIPEVQQLRKQFKGQKVQRQKQFKVCYSSIYMTRSRLQLYDFPIRQNKVDFLNPVEEKQNIRYDDSSDEYSQLIADSINEEMVQQDEEQENQSQSNSAIVSDSFCQYESGHMVSSSQSEDEQQKDKLKPQITKTIGSWLFTAKDDAKQRARKYQMICLIQDTFPIIVKEIAEQNNEITANQKVQMYKQIHGSFIPKQILIKKVNVIVDNKISMNKLSTVIKDICQKKGNQRVIKKQIIRELAQQLYETYPNLQAQLQQIRQQRQNIRNQQAETKRQERMNEKDQKIEKLILQYVGPISTHCLLQYLRNNEIKIVKQDLNSLIQAKQGQKWEQIRSQIKKSKLMKSKKQKKQKVVKIKPQKQTQQDHIKNTHRPIDEILRQNQIAMMNRPKKQIKQSEMVPQMAEQQQQKQQLIQQYHEPSDDQSFQLKAKKSSKKSSSKRKNIVKIAPLLPPVRRNPKRNKKKSKKYSEIQQNKQEAVNQGQLQENLQILAQKNIDSGQNKQGSIKQEQQMKGQVKDISQAQGSPEIKTNYQGANQINKAQIKTVDNKVQLTGQLVANQQIKKGIDLEVSPQKQMQLVSRQKIQQVERTANKDVQMAISSKVM